MLSVKDAAAKTAEYFNELYGSQFGNVLIEEVEQQLERDGTCWYITLGYGVPSVLFQFGGKPPRGYKVFKINAETGDVLSMKIREAAPVE
jgi:hypothetical protein